MRMVLSALYWAITLFQAPLMPVETTVCHFENFQPLLTLSHHKPFYGTQMAWSPDGTHLATWYYEDFESGHIGYSIYTWNLATGARSYITQGATMYSVVWLNDALLVDVARTFGKNVGSGVERWQIEPVPRLIYTFPFSGTISVSPNAERIAILFLDFYVFDVENNQQLEVIEAGAGVHDNQPIWIASGLRWIDLHREDDFHEETIVKVIEHGRADPIFAVTLDDILHMARLSPSGRLLLTMGVNRSTVWDVESGQVVADVEGTPLYPQWSPDERCFGAAQYVSPNNYTTHIWDAQTGQMLTTLPERYSVPQWSPDGTLIAVYNLATQAIDIYRIASAAS